MTSPFSAQFKREPVEIRNGRLVYEGDTDINGDPLPPLADESCGPGSDGYLRGCGEGVRRDGG